MTVVSDSTVSDALREAARLVRGGWTRRAFARDQLDRLISHSSPEAVCFCVRGAVARACGLNASEGLSPKPLRLLRSDCERMIIDRLWTVTSVEQRVGRNWFSKDDWILVDWNDERAADGDEVASLLEAAAAECAP